MSELLDRVYTGEFDGACAFSPRREGPILKNVQGGKLDRWPILPSLLKVYRKSYAAKEPVVSETRRTV